MGRINIKKGSTHSDNEKISSTQTRKILTANEITIRLKKNDWLISTASAYINTLTQFIAQEGCSLFLTDDEGCVLFISSEERLLDEFKKNYIIPGTFPTTGSALENSISQVIFKGKDLGENTGKSLISKTKEQHTCWALPLMLNAQQTVGSIALCAPTSATNKYLLTLLKLCAKCIEQDLLLGKEKSQTKMLQDEQLNIFNSHAHADIVVTGKGVIDLISDKTCELLGLKRKDILHQNITTIIPDWKKILLPNSRQKEFNNIEFEITNVTNAGAYLLNGRVLRVSSGLVDEMIFNLRSMKQVLSESNKYNGNIATFTFDDINCVSVPMKRIIKDAKSIAHLDSHVILIGEKYTGKRIIAEAIHNQSKRMEFGFVRVNLSNATEDEMEEILWGYTEKHKPYKKWVPKPGAFEFANGGSLYINEIGMLPLRLQDKLLETITTKKTSRLGSKSLTMVDVRIFATNSYDLSAQIDRGDFRIELFYALSGSSLRVPALRERKQDVPALLKETIEIKSLEMGKKAPVIPKKNLLILKRYEWPNNFKEMKEFAELLINDQGKMFKNFKNERDFKRKHLYLDYQKEVESIVPLEEVEMQHIIKAYKALGGSISKTSRKLGVSRNTLYLKLKKYGFDEELES